MQCSHELLYTLHPSNSAMVPFTIYTSLPSNLPTQKQDDHYRYGCYCPLTMWIAFFNTLNKCIEMYDSKKLQKQIYIGHTILGIDYDTQGTFYYYTSKHIYSLQFELPQLIYTCSHAMQQVQWNHFFHEKNPYAETTMAILFSNGTVQFYNTTTQSMVGMINCPPTCKGILFQYHLCITFGKQSIFINDSHTHYEILHYTSIVKCELLLQKYIIVLDEYRTTVYGLNGEMIEQFDCHSFFIKDSQLIHSTTLQVLFNAVEQVHTTTMVASMYSLCKHIAMQYPITFFYKNNTTFCIEYDKVMMQIVNQKIQLITLHGNYHKQQEILSNQFTTYTKQYKSLEQQIVFVIYQVKQLFLKKIVAHDLLTVPSPRVSLATFSPNGTLVMITNATTTTTIAVHKQYEEWKKKSHPTTTIAPLVHLYQTTLLLPFHYEFIKLLKTPDIHHTANQICLYNSQCVYPYSSTSAMIYQYLYHLLSFHPQHPFYYKTMQIMYDYVKQSRDVQLASMIGLVLQNNSQLFYWSRKYYAELLHWWGYDCLAMEITPPNHVQSKEFEIQVNISQKNLICCKCHCRIKGLAMEMGGEWMHWKCNTKKK